MARPFYHLVVDVGVERAYAGEFVAAGLRALAQRCVTEHEVPDRDETARLAFKLQSGSVFRS